MRKSRSTLQFQTARSFALPFALALGLTLAVAPARAQSAVLVRAMQQETNGDLKGSVASYREALARGEFVPALLGLERVFAQLRWNDSLVPLVDSAVVRTPREPIVRTMQLRLLRTLRRDAQARAAFQDWVAAAPNDIAPYREWARLLLAEGRTASVDSVLSEAQQKLGSMAGLTVEVAQLRSALGQWDRAAMAWREAVKQQEYLESAASFSLRSAPPDARRIVRAVLLSPPVEKAPRRLLASLELGWGNGIEGWMAIRELPPNDSTAAVWTAFSDDAERRGQWLAARDALLAVQEWRPDTQRMFRAASLALEGGDAESALRLATAAATRIGGAAGEKAALTIRLRAFAKLGRGAEAQRAYSDCEQQLTPTERQAQKRVVAWAWVRGGQITEARAMLDGAEPDPDEELTGWLALYEGDLVGARRGLRRADPRVPGSAFAVAFVSRTKVNRAPLAGQAFLTLARGDSLKAADAFVAAAAEVADAASVLLLTASRLHSEQKRESQAITIWKLLVEKHFATPEAPEAELEWARSLRKSGARADAIAHLEHLILSWPDSALLPQARRELELAKGSIPGDTLRA